MDVCALMNKSKVMSRAPSMIEDDMVDTTNDDEGFHQRAPSSDMGASPVRTRSHAMPPPSPPIDNRYDSFADEQQEKHEILLALERLRSKGFRVSDSIGFSSSLSELKFELARNEAEYNRKYGVRVGQRFLLAFVSGIEFVNKKFDPFDVDLDGWSNVVHDRIDDFDNVLERLIVKYRNRVAVAPEIELIMMLAGSALTFHMSKSLAKRVESAFKNVVMPPPTAPAAGPGPAAPTAASTAPPPTATAPKPSFDLAGIASRLAPMMANLQTRRVVPTPTPVPAPVPVPVPVPVPAPVVAPPPKPQRSPTGSIIIGGDDDDDGVVDADDGGIFGGDTADVRSSTSSILI
jgi:hypothetical protein